VSSVALERADYGPERRVVAGRYHRQLQQEGALHSNLGVDYPLRSYLSRFPLRNSSAGRERCVNAPTKIGTP
jgi:hypothetical protein